MQYLQEQIEILDGSIRKSNVEDLRARMQTGYSAPVGTQPQSNQNVPAAESVDASQLKPHQAQPASNQVYDSSFSIDPASTARIVDRLPALDPNLSLPKQLGDQEKFIGKQVKKQSLSKESQEIDGGLGGYAFKDGRGSSGT